MSSRATNHGMPEVSSKARPAADAATTGPGSVPIGSTGNWSLASDGGSAVGVPTPTTLVFTMAASVGGLTLNTGTSSYVTASSVGGIDGAFTGTQGINTDANHNLGVTSGMYLSSGTTGYFDPPGNGLPFAYLSNGLPNLAAIDLAQSQGSYFETLDSGSTEVDEGELLYTLTSLQPESAVPPGGEPVYQMITTPLPGALGLFLAGFGGLGTFSASLGRKRSR